MAAAHRILHTHIGSMASSCLERYLAFLCAPRSTCCAECIDLRLPKWSVPPGGAGEPAATGDWLRHFTRHWRCARSTHRACAHPGRDTWLTDPGLTSIAQCLLAPTSNSVARTERAGNHLCSRNGGTLLDYARGGYGR